MMCIQIVVLDLLAHMLVVICVCCAFSARGGHQEQQHQMLKQFYTRRAAFDSPRVPPPSKVSAAEFW